MLLSGLRARSWPFPSKEPSADGTSGLRRCRPERMLCVLEFRIDLGVTFRFIDQPCSALDALPAELTVAAASHSEAHAFDIRFGDVIAV